MMSELALVQSKKNSTAGYWSYAKNFTYNSTGAVESMQLGNGKWESTTFNSRLQPTQIALGTVQGGTDKLKLNFDYNTSGQNDNNGNVLKQTITVPTVGTDNGFTAIQTYNYDELNRLKSAEETIGGSTSWKQTFTFDRYGNKRFDEANTDTLQGGCATAVCNPTIDPATNKLVGYTFDNVGNTEVDANGQTFTYDAENKQILVKDATNNTVGEYFYDGDGKRIKKIAGSEETIFVYNASGQLVADYSNQISQTPKVSYLTSDHLGSPRITTDMDGDIYTRRDFMPFGEEIDIDHTPERTATLNYASDEIRQKFTSYERDNETNLDFAQARMYANKLGRFTSTDPILMSPERAVDPQRINLYIYVRNNPLILVDSTGEDIDDNDLSDNEDYQIWKTAFRDTNEGKRLWDKYSNSKYTIKIEWKEGSDGGETHSFRFKDGELVGATITLGGNIDNTTLQSRKDDAQYPLLSAVGKANIGRFGTSDDQKTTVAIMVIAHEFGHLEEADAKPAQYQILQETADIGNNLREKFGNKPNAEISKAQKRSMDAFGAKDSRQFAIDRDNFADKAAIPVIQQRYVNLGKKVPKSVQNAIIKLQGGNK